MAKFAKGCPRLASAGRRAGTPNKVTTAMREAFRLAFDELGGVPALVAWGKRHPTEFYKLVARLIPVELSGPGGSAIPHAMTIDVRFVKPVIRADEKVALSAEQWRR